MWETLKSWVWKLQKYLTPWVHRNYFYLFTYTSCFPLWHLGVLTIKNMYMYKSAHQGNLFCMLLSTGLHDITVSSEIESVRFLLSRRETSLTFFPYLQSRIISSKKKFNPSVLWLKNMNFPFTPATTTLLTWTLPAFLPSTLSLLLCQ